jgi:aminoglycoside phosphotransferase (APT) family kinase protein
MVRDGQPAGLAKRLGEYLRGRVDAAVDVAVPPTPLGGGAFSQVFRFELASAPVEWSGPLVLRLLATSAEQVRLEAGLQEGARAASVPAPRMLAVEADPGVLGQPFMIMELLPGRGFLRGIEWHRFVRDFPKMLTSWPGTFADVLGLLAAANTSTVLDTLSRRGVPADSASTTRHLSWIEGTLGLKTPFVDIVEWLNANQPEPPDRPVLVHGDLWPANVLMVGRVIGGLVDWTMGAIGDPALDVGFAKVGLALMPEPFPPPPPISTGLHAGGVRMADEIHERCAPLVGGDERVRYYEALRCAVEIAAVQADRRLGRRNGWIHGLNALARHFNKMTGLEVNLR